jgi:uncharacterized protein (TIGR00369 family)
MAETRSKKPRMLDALHSVLRGELPEPPVAHLIGFKLVEVSEGHPTVLFEAGSQHANPMGTLHGGILCDIADAAMGIAYAATLDVDESFTTLELKINFLKPVWKAILRAEGRVVKRGRTIGLTECDITNVTLQMSRVAWSREPPAPA